MGNSFDASLQHHADLLWSFSSAITTLSSEADVHLVPFNLPRWMFDGVIHLPNVTEQTAI